MSESFDEIKWDRFLRRVTLADQDNSYEMTLEAIGFLLPELVTSQPKILDQEWNNKLALKLHADAFESAAIQIFRHLFPGWEYAMGDDHLEGFSGWARIFPPYPDGYVNGSGNQYAQTPALALLAAIIFMRIRQLTPVPRAPR